jgi:four helix bundle protein
MMTEVVFDHDRLDVYRLAIEYTADSFDLAKDLNGIHRHARDQWLRAAQSIPLNIAEGNGKRGPKDRGRFFEIARGSAFECAAIQDVLTASSGLEPESNAALKLKLKRIVSMLTRMVMKTGGVSESQAEYHAAIDYDYEHEHERTVEPEQELHRRTRRRFSANQRPPRVLGEFYRSPALKSVPKGHDSHRVFGRCRRQHHWAGRR